MNLDQERRDLRRKLVGDFKGCLATVKAGDNPARLACAEKLQRSATESIGLAVGHTQVSSQLGSGKRPEINKIEAALKACAAAARGGDRLGSDLDSCMKKYTLELASYVGDVKLKASLNSMLGAQEYANATPELVRALVDYRGCLDKLNALPLDKNFMNGLDACAADLTARARGIVRLRLRNWFDNPVAGTDPSSNVRDALVHAIPCLDILMPSSPESGIAEAGVDAEGMLQALVKFLKNYIDYDALRAENDVSALLAGLQKDLQSIGLGEARKNLLTLLEERHALDQVLKALVRSTASDMLFSAPKDQRLPDPVLRQLLSKDNFDKLFSGPEGQRIVKKAMDGLVRPMLADNKAWTDPAIVDANAGIRRDVGDLLADSSSFGTLVIDATVQKQMDDLDVVSWFFAWIWYGSDSLDWSKVRNKPAGREAVQYIRDAVLRPQTQGVTLSEEELEKRMKIAKDKVTKAATS